MQFVLLIGAYRAQCFTGNEKAMDKDAKSQVLVVDDEKCMRVTLKDFLEDEGFMVTTAGGFDEALQLLTAGDFDVAVIDRLLSNGHSGLDLIEYLTAAKPLCQTILITAYPTFESAQVSLRLGSSDYLVKPVARADICSAVMQAAAAGRLKRRESAKSVTPQ
jgi:DNA-binding NtrC family response regulator